MKRQQLRKMLLIFSLLLFPVTLYYFSPALIMNAGLSGVINGSFLVFVLLFLFSIPFGRLFCAFLCPAGGIQESAFMREKSFLSLFLLDGAVYGDRRKAAGVPSASGTAYPGQKAGTVCFLWKVSKGLSHECRCHAGD